ncbi:MAG TPA: hypothetical protein VKY80_11505 [Croceibacterium sp.]|nr:hypothetical protein [Croceibacterium sp.]
MFAFLKAVVLGAALAFIVSLFIGSGGSTGGLLNVRAVSVAGFDFYWSWALFVVGAGLSFGLFLLMD